MRRWILVAALALGLAVGGALPAAAAELRQVESVGVVPILGSGARQPPRDAAVRAAVARAVEDVAHSILPAGWEENVPPGSRSSGEAQDVEPRLAGVLGSDPFEYATRFRIVEDRGVRDAVFSQEAKTEYVAVVEVFVDAGRLRERFASAGWLGAPAGAGAGAIRIVLQDLTSFRAYESFRRTLIDDLGMESAVPLELSRGRAVLTAAGPYDAAELQEALVRRVPEGLRIVPLSREGETLTLLIDDVAPPAAPARAEEPAADAE